MEQRAYRRLIGPGPRNGPEQILLAGLRGVAVGYGLAVRLRNFAYDRRLLPSVRVSVPVISVGNLTTGGTGKTPLVIWLYERLAARGRRCGILTRGYKSDAARLTDEPAILVKSCPDAHVVVDPDRVAGARRAIAEAAVDVLLLDDGLQHRHLHRDLDIVTIDATCPFGYGRMLPAGLLREPVGALRRADAVVVTHYDHIEPARAEDLLSEIAQRAGDAFIATAVHVHSDVRLSDGRTMPVESLKGRRLFAFCGIGNPDAFLDRLNRQGLTVVGSRIFNDHHTYTPADVAALHDQARHAGAEMLLCTEKDWDKAASPSRRTEEIPLACLRLRLEFVDGADRIEALIDRTLSVEPTSEQP